MHRLRSKAKFSNEFLYFSCLFKTGCTSRTCSVFTASDYFDYIEDYLHFDHRCGFDVEKIYSRS